jgi:hypothetical protein
VAGRLRAAASPAPARQNARNYFGGRSAYTVAIASGRKRGGAVDTHGAREQDMCVFVYVTDHETEPAIDRRPMRFMEVYIGHVAIFEKMHVA